MASEVNSDVPSESALMVYATLSNPEKSDPTLVVKSSEKEEQNNLDRIQEVDERSDTSQQSRRSFKSDKSRSERSESRSEGSRRSKSDREDESDKESDFDEKIHEQANINSYGDYYIREAESQRDMETETLEKQSLLLDLQRLKIQGIQLSKEWTINDKLEDMTLEIRRHTLHMDEVANVQTMRDGLRFVCTGIEMLNNRVGLLDLEGWSSEVCKDLGKHDANLSRIYRKYWRRTSSSSPELDIAASLVASMGMYHFKQKMNKKIYDNRGPRKTSTVSRSKQIEEEEDDDEEEAPP